ncbi:MAG: hypothetical protein OQK05_03460 [Pseudopelagicola sp.]|nr:hypothetical protein [Pseudopelagicola sp.]
MTPEQVQELFTLEDGAYAFARWGRPIAPIVFGVEEETLSVVKGAVEAVVTLVGHQMAETDAELGVNLMIFFLRDWDELAAVPDLDRLIPELEPLLGRLKEADATQYRAFRFDEHGAIKAAFVFVRMAGVMAELSAESIALAQAVQVMLLWGPRAFVETSPLAVLPEGGATVLRPEIAAVLAAAYDRMMPVAAQDPSHALRLFARLRLEDTAD